jgi:hypothetical protein
MANKLISDCQTKLAYRLGSTSAPTDATELAKRRGWMWEAIATVNSDEYMWFMKKYATDTAITNKPYYDIPTRFRHPIIVKVDGLIYNKTTKEDFEKEHSSYNQIVTIPSVSIIYEYYIYDDHVYFSPDLTAPTAVTVTLTSVTTTATATSTSAHGFLAGQFVTIAGANETNYNGAFEILTVPSTTTFTYTIVATTSPATGTITATLKNIEYWYYEEATEPTAESSEIVIPDKYDYIPVSYAEGRYWSSAHKRGKAADAFTEFETGLMKIKQENFRRKFGQEV